MLVNTTSLDSHLNLANGSAAAAYGPFLILKSFDDVFLQLLPSRHGPRRCLPDTHQTRFRSASSAYLPLARLLQLVYNQHQARISQLLEELL
eukprot:153406-Hanusia_phi.AAC.1